MVGHNVGSTPRASNQKDGLPRRFTDYLQKSHVDHPICPQLIQAGARLHMGQFSMTISAVAGSVLSDNQHLVSMRGIILQPPTPPAVTSA